MKRTLLAVVAIGCLAVVAAPQASAQGVRWGVSGGLLMPLGDYKKADKTGWIVGAGVTNWLTGGSLGLRADVSLGETKEKTGVAAHTTKIVGGMASLVLGLGSSDASMRPFLTGGLGFYNVKIDAPAFSESKIAFGIGGGLMFKVGTGGMRLVLATRYTSVSTSGGSKAFLPITVGLTFGK